VSYRDVTLFKSVGTAVQDIVTAYAVYEAAVRDNIGTVIDMEA
jgi:ornithine cyclodeaminase/alanine dehydrogenase-like protein (mu-crystallin family)